MTAGAGGDGGGGGGSSSSSSSGSSRSRRSTPPSGRVERVRRGLFPVQIGTLATHGFLVCLLPQTMVVSSKIIEPIQVLQCSVQRLGAPVDGRRDYRGTHLEQPHPGRVFDGRGHRDQRMERIQEIFRQSGHVSVCLHHVRQSPDRFENLRARRSLRRTRRLLDQDANPGRHDCGFHPAFTQTLRASLPDAIRVPTPPRALLPGRTSSTLDECGVLDETG